MDSIIPPFPLVLSNDLQRNRIIGTTQEGPKFANITKEAICLATLIIPNNVCGTNSKSIHYFANP